MLTNPFYYGHFRYGGEVYEGKHTPIVSKKLFDEVQTVFEIRRHKRTTKHNEPKPLCGLLRCGSCNMMITGENQSKRQKNGNVHYYTYYHCTKKRKNVPRCPEPHIRQELLDAQLSNLLNGYALPDSWADALNKMLANDERKEQNDSSLFVANAQTKIAGLQSKLQRLLDGYLDQDIERDVYVQKKSSLMSEKKSLEEQSSKLLLAGSAWVEPMKQWIETAVSICKTTNSDDLVAKKSLCFEIFGSNLFLKNKQAHFCAPVTLNSPHKTPWVALGASLQNVRKIKESIVLVQLAQKSLHSIRVEIARWHNILEVPYQEYLRSGSVYRGDVGVAQYAS